MLRTNQTVRWCLCFLLWFGLGGAVATASSQPGAAGVGSEKAPSAAGADSTGIRADEANRATSSSRTATVRLDPERVEMGLFFYEGHVAVEGRLPRDFDAAVIVRGRDEQMTMSLRGRRLGLWMTVGSAEFDHVPAFYQVLTSKPLSAMAAKDPGARADLGFDTVKQAFGMRIESSDTSDEVSGKDWKGELVKYMKKRGLYAIHERALEILPEDGGMETVRGDILVPARAPDGRYDVALLGFSHGAAVLRAHASFTVRQVGTVAFLRNLAFEHGWLYGIMAVVIALASGLGVGALMPSKGGRSGK